MDSASLLDLLGNENRRRILRLLARKPCYVTEISDYLGVSPKAVIDHLAKLEEAGLVESHVDDGRRKYFSIARNLRLEVNVSPYDFGTKSAYSASSSLDVTSCRYLSVNVDRSATEENPDLPSLASDLKRLEQLENELSLVQRWVHGRLTDTLDRISRQFDGVDGRFYADIIRALANGASSREQLSRRIDAPPELVQEALRRLEAYEIVEETDTGWQLL